MLSQSTIAIIADRFAARVNQVPAPRIRKMVVGHNGDTIRAVGVAARLEIEQLLKRPVHLYLNVRVRS